MKRESTNWPQSTNASAAGNEQALQQAKETFRLLIKLYRPSGIDQNEESRFLQKTH